MPPAIRRGTGGKTEETLLEMRIARTLASEIPNKELDGLIDHRDDKASADFWGDVRLA